MTPEEWRADDRRRAQEVSDAYYYMRGFLGAALRLPKEATDAEIMEAVQNLTLPPVAS